MSTIAQPSPRDYASEQAAILAQSEAAAAAQQTSILGSISPYYRQLARADQQYQAGQAQFLSSSPYQSYTTGSLSYLQGLAQSATQSGYGNAAFYRTIGEQAAAQGSQAERRFMDQGDQAMQIADRSAAEVRGAADTIGAVGNDAYARSERYAGDVAGYANTFRGLGDTAVSQLNSDLGMQLEKQAAADLALGKSLSAEDQRLASQSARGAFAARGLATGEGGAAAEILNRDAYGTARQDQRRSFATQINELSNAERARRLQLGGSFYGSAQGALAQAAGIDQSGRQIQLGALNSRASLYNAAGATQLQGAQLRGSLYGSAQQAQQFGLGMLSDSYRAAGASEAQGLQTAQQSASAIGNLSVAGDPYRAAGTGYGTSLLGQVGTLYSNAAGSQQNYGADLYNTNLNMQASLHNTQLNNEAALQSAQEQAAATSAAAGSAQSGALIGAGGAVLGGVAIAI